VPCRAQDNPAAAPDAQRASCLEFGGWFALPALGSLLYKIRLQELAEIRQKG
jgi:hypothetical protein